MYLFDLCIPIPKHTRSWFSLTQASTALSLLATAVRVDAAGTVADVVHAQGLPQRMLQDLAHLPHAAILEVRRGSALGWGGARPQGGHDPGAAGPWPKAAESRVRRGAMLHRRNRPLTAPCTAAHQSIPHFPQPTNARGVVAEAALNLLLALALSGVDREAHAANAERLLEAQLLPSLARCEALATHPETLAGGP